MLVLVWVGASGEGFVFWCVDLGIFVSGVVCSLILGWVGVDVVLGLWILLG